MNDPELQRPRYRALLQLLRTADAIWEASRLFFAPWNLSPSQFNVLNLLRLNSRGLTQSDLSRHLIVNRSNITGLVDRLEQRGWVRRTEVAADRRAYRVVLTEAGSRILREILPAYHAGAERALQVVSEERAARWADELARVAENVRSVARDAAVRSQAGRDAVNRGSLPRKRRKPGRRET